MHIYYGKINWLTYATDETFTLVLPRGFSKGDPVGAFWRWTVNNKGETNVNQNYIGKITSADAAKREVVLFGEPDFYKFNAVQSEDGTSLTVTMSNKNGTTASATNLTKVTLTGSDLSRSIGASVYTGKFNYHGFAKDEMMTIISPAYSGLKVPIVAIWQWTTDKDGNKKVTRVEGQDSVDSLVGQDIKFFQDHYYKFAGEISKDGKTLALKVKANDGYDSIDVKLELAQHYG